MPVSNFEKSLLGKTFSWAFTAGRYIVITTELIVIIAFFSRFKLDRDLADLHQSIEEKQTIIESFAKLEKQVRFLQERTKIIQALESDQMQAAKILEDLAQITPSDIYLNELSLTKEALSAGAVALSDASLANFLSNLQKSGKFEEINLTSLTTGGSKAPSVKFTFKAEIK